MKRQALSRLKRRDGPVWLLDLDNTLHEQTPACQNTTDGEFMPCRFDDKPGSRRAEFCWPGNQMFPALDADLHFGYQLTGSLVVAHGPKEEE